MASTPVVPLYDSEHFPKILNTYLDRSGQLQCTSDFIKNILPNILSSIGNGKSQLNVIGVGSGTGNVDLEIISQLRLKHPERLVDHEVVEPSSQQLRKYKDMVNQNLDLDFVEFTWNQMTTTEFEEQWRQKNITKKADLIHMVQMLYHVDDPGATISFFQSLLNKNGKLLIFLRARDHIEVVISKVVQGQLCQGWRDIPSMSMELIKNLLDARGVPYQSHELQSTADITECFTEGDETGEMLLDFLTSVQDFSKTASAELRQEVMTLLRDNSVEEGGRVMVNDKYEVIVLNALD